jgi:hypothetical protein
MKVVYNNIFPFHGFVALTLYPWIFVRKEYKNKFNAKAERHENTHAKQQLECLWIFFFIIYILEWAVKGVICLFTKDNAYRSISFEQEAYEHEDEVYYNDVRKHFAWIRYIFKLKSKNGRV